MDISSRIKELRRQCGLNQFELAEEVGVSVDTVRRWESNKQLPRADEFNNLACVLKVSVEELLNGPATQKWELRMIVSKTGDKEGGTVDMTGTTSTATLSIGDTAMAITLSADYALWEDDAKFDALMEDLRRKRQLGLKTRKEGWQ